MFAGRNLLRHKLEMGGLLSLEETPPSPFPPRPQLVEGVPGRGKVVYKREAKHFVEKYDTVKYTGTAKITGIACVPVENKTIQSAQATVTAGGLNHNHVDIYLKPTQSGKWAYQLAISAEEPKPSQQADSTDAAAGANGGGDNGASS